MSDVSIPLNLLEEIVDYNNCTYILENPWWCTTHRMNRLYLGEDGHGKCVMEALITLLWTERVSGTPGLCSNCGHTGMAHWFSEFSKNSGTPECILLKWESDGRSSFCGCTKWVSDNA